MIWCIFPWVKSNMVLMVVMGMRQLLLVAIYNIKGGHHPCSMVLDDMAMVHPCPGAVIRHPGNLYGTPGS
jgi:hypothetical protein